MPSLIGALEALIEKGTELSRYDRDRVFKEGQESVLSQPGQYSVSIGGLLPVRENAIAQLLVETLRQMHLGQRGQRHQIVYDDQTGMLALAVSGVDKELREQLRAPDG